MNKQIEFYPRNLFGGDLIASKEAESLGFEVNLFLYVDFYTFRREEINRDRHFYYEDEDEERNLG